MKTQISISVILPLLFSVFVVIGCKQKKMTDNSYKIAETIVSLEKEALNRWGKGDPYGYLEIFANEVTYFNPFEESRVDSLAAMNKYYGDQAGQIFIDEYKFIDPKVQIHGNVAILTYLLYNYKKQPDGTLKETRRWNSTKVYALIDGKWKIVHNHWSFIQPELK